MRCSKCGTENPSDWDPQQWEYKLNERLVPRMRAATNLALPPHDEIELPREAFRAARRAALMRLMQQTLLWRVVHFCIVGLL